MTTTTTASVADVYVPPSQHLRLDLPLLLRDDAARVVDVDNLDDYLIDLLWRPFLLLLAVRRRNGADDGDAASAAARTTSNDIGSALRGCMLLVDKLSRRERIEVMRLLTLVALGTTPASQLLGLRWWTGSAGGSTGDKKGVVETTPQWMLSMIPRPLYLYSLLRTSAIFLRRYHLHVKKKMLVLKQRRQQQQQQREVQRPSSSTTTSAERDGSRDGSSERQRQRSRHRRRGTELQQQHDREEEKWMKRQEWMCCILHKLIAVGRLAVLFGSVMDCGVCNQVPWRADMVAHPSRYGLAMLLSGISYRDMNDEGDSGSPGELNGSTPALHVNYAHRRWLWREGSAAAQLLWAGILSSNVLREAWGPLFMEMYEQTQKLWEHSLGWFWVGRSLGQQVIKTDSSHRGGRIMSGGAAALVKNEPVCPICGTRNMKIPVRASCGHVYCYTCLYRRSLQPQRLGDAGAAVASSSAEVSQASVLCRLCRNPITYACPIPR